MNVLELYDQFRSDVVDVIKPPIWSDDDVFRYMDDAYKMFVRLTGGIADFTSDFTRANIVTGEKVGEYDKRILRIMKAYRESDRAEIKVINQTDLTFIRGDDYGLLRPAYLDSAPGPVRYMVIGLERGKCEWLQVPLTDDVALLHVYRLPKDRITPDISEDFDFPEIGEEHVPHLGLWMKHKAYAKADTDRFNGPLSDKYKTDFTDYCALAKAEVERAKHKNREVVYGGI